MQEDTKEHHREDFFKTLFIYLRESIQAVEMAEGEGEAGSLLSREPDAGLDPRTLGSRPEPKADTQPLNHPGAPHTTFLKLLQ